jgi:hypothetical protein
MNKLLLSVLILTLAGCGPRGKVLMYMHGMAVHEAKVSIKNGVPCFLPLGNLYLVGKPVHLKIIHVGDKNGEIWQKPLDIEDALSKKCVPYEGSTVLKKDTVYGAGFSAYVEGQRTEDTHSFVVAFCMTEGKGGKTILHHVDPFAANSGDVTCPASSLK